METYCTRPGCPRPLNAFADLDDTATLKTIQQKFCTACGMPQILIGRYLPIKLLGQGGFGAAFLAIDRYTPAMRQCVVKQFQPSGDLNPNQLKVAQELFEREGEVLEKLGNRHPQIPDLLAFFELSVPDRTPGKTNQFFYLVQEFIDGENLEEELAHRGAFSQTEVLKVLVEILKVLKFVHDNGSIHRDIKLSNIMRDRSGQLHLLDFGAVKQVAAGGAASSGSSTGIYSMGFAPPEQMAGNVVYPATDLYALGVTCISLLTGKQPNELYDPYGNRWNWVGYAKVSPWFEAILNRLLLPSASDRYQSAEEVLDAINQGVNAATAHAAASVSASAQASQPIGKSTGAIAPPTPAPVPSTTSPAASGVPTKAPSQIPILAVLGGAAFTGFEGGLLAIALASFGATVFIGTGFWLVLIGALVAFQFKHWIEKWDLPIIAVITLLIVLGITHFLPSAQTLFAGLGGSPLMLVLVLAIFGSLITVAIATLFLLVYKIFSNFL
jgi:serine/threonine-protein kinase